MWLTMDLQKGSSKHNKNINFQKYNFENIQSIVSWEHIKLPVHNSPAICSNLWSFSSRQ